MTEIQISGFDAVRKNLEKLGDKDIIKVLRQLTFEGAKIVRDKAKSKAPKNRGMLQKSIKVKRRRGTPSQVMASVGWEKPKGAHGHLTEFGHEIWSGPGRGHKGEKGKPTGRRTKAQPHITEAYMESKDEVLKHFVDELQADKLSRRIIKPVKGRTRGFTRQFG